MTTIKTKCERCKQEQNCQFYGHPAEVEEEKSQNGEWLCLDCVPLRMKELDNAIERMNKLLDGGN